MNELDLMKLEDDEILEVYDGMGDSEAKIRFVGASTNIYIYIYVLSIQPYILHRFTLVTPPRIFLSRLLIVTTYL